MIGQNWRKKEQPGSSFGVRNSLLTYISTIYIDKDQWVKVMTLESRFLSCNNFRHCSSRDKHSRKIPIKTVMHKAHIFQVATNYGTETKVKAVLTICSHC